MARDASTYRVNKVSPHKGQGQKRRDDVGQFLLSEQIKTAQAKIDAARAEEAERTRNARMVAEASAATEKTDEDLIREQAEKLFPDGEELPEPGAGLEKIIERINEEVSVGRGEHLIPVKKTRAKKSASKPIEVVQEPITEPEAAPKRARRVAVIDHPGATFAAAALMGTLR